MQLICKHCGHISKSLSVIKDDAVAEVMLDFSKHITSVHGPKTSKEPKDTIFGQWLADCQMLSAVGPTVILVAKHSTLLDGELDTEDYIQEKFSLLVDQIQDYLGIEVFDNKPTEKGESKSSLPAVPGLSLPQMT